MCPTNSLGTRRQFPNLRHTAAYGDVDPSELPCRQGPFSYSPPSNCNADSWIICIIHLVSVTLQDVLTTPTGSAPPSVRGDADREAAEGDPQFPGVGYTITQLPADPETC